MESKKRLFHPLFLRVSTFGIVCFDFMIHFFFLFFVIFLFLFYFHAFPQEHRFQYLILSFYLEIFCVFILFVLVEFAHFQSWRFNLFISKEFLKFFFLEIWIKVLFSVEIIYIFQCSDPFEISSRLPIFFGFCFIRFRLLFLFFSFAFVSFISGFSTSSTFGISVLIRICGRFECFYESQIEIIVNYK